MAAVRTSEQLRKEHRNPSAVTSLVLNLRALSDVSCLAGFVALERLDLSCNNIRTLEGLGCCGNLKWLSVAQNKVVSLKGADALSNLTVLNAGQNMIQSMDEVRALTNLRALILNDNKITSICKLEPLKHLNTLVLSRNPIEDIGQSLVNVKSLTKISLSDCEIQEIGSSLISCLELKEARFAHNQIATIPNQITKNSKLQLLDLGKNAISRWSDIKALSELHNLKNLNLQGNPIAEKDEIVKKVRKLAPKLQIFNAKPIEKFSVTKKNPAEGISASDNGHNSLKDAVSVETRETKKKKGRTDSADENALPINGTKNKRVKTKESIVVSKAVENENPSFGHGEAKWRKGGKNQKHKKSKGVKSSASETIAAPMEKDQSEADLEARKYNGRKPMESRGSKAVEFDDEEAPFLDLVFSGKDEEVGEHKDNKFLGGLVIDPTKKKKKIRNVITGRAALIHLPPATDVGMGGASAWDD